MQDIDDILDFLLYEKGTDIIYNGICKRVLIKDSDSIINYEDDKQLYTDFSINTGDLIQYKNSNWFVISQIDKHEKTYRSRIRKVEQSFKMILDNKLYTFPAIFEPANQSVQTSSVINVWSGNLKVILQDTDLSKKIDVNLEFIKMGAKWKVDGYTTEHLGLRTLYCEKGQFGTNDDQVNEIADIDLLAHYNLIIANGSFIQMGVNQTLQLNAIATVTIGGKLSILTNTKINYLSSDITKASVDSNGLVTFYNNIGNVNISASLDLDNSATNNIAIAIVSDSQNNYTVDVTSDGQVIEGITDITLNSTKIFVGTRKNNGFDVPNSQFNFEIIPGKTLASKYTLTVLNDASCSIKALGSTYFITLRCHDRNDNSVYIDKTIRLKSGF
ncbi:hypothetical protein J2Z42_001377 [Clostridium algifaecis]|uniref:Uncharacterized protein n=1 Tax=Clostridium algifaecis TaxID=1472040 RepID=A0ABS4KRP3_9CLOT|nr:hypothetical protein [Clostridium algifaecis]MBP2032703.1 hypothetical protein [Clostridium algifaecis]